jgi:hypothetical protein
MWIHGDPDPNPQHCCQVAQIPIRRDFLSTPATDFLFNAEPGGSITCKPMVFGQINSTTMDSRCEFFKFAKSVCY